MDSNTYDCRDAEEAHSSKNDVLQQSKELEKKIKMLEAELAQIQVSYLYIGISISIKTLVPMCYEKYMGWGGLKTYISRCKLKHNKIYAPVKCRSQKFARYALKNPLKLCLYYQEDLSAAERGRRTAETERDELAEELSSSGSKEHNAKHKEQKQRNINKINI